MGLVDQYLTGTLQEKRPTNHMGPFPLKSIERLRLEARVVSC